MISIRNIIRPFRKNFDGEDFKDRARLCEAFEALEDNLRNILTSETGSKFYTKAYSSVGLNTLTGVPVALAFNSETSENGGMHSNTSQNTRFTIQRAGIYSIWANVQWPGVGAGGTLLQLQIKVNGVTFIASRIDYDPGVGFNQDQIVTGGDYFNIGDYIEIIATQASGGAVVIPVVANFSPYAFIMEN